MDTIELFLQKAPEERLVGDKLGELLREWIRRTPLADRLVDVRLAPDGEEAVARLRAEERVLEVRLHHEGGPGSHRLLLDAWTWVTPELPRRIWSWIVGLAVGLAGLALTWAWLAEAYVGFLMGVVASALLATVVANTAWRAAVDRRIRRATEASGGQRPAQHYLEQLDDVVRHDPRVGQVVER